MIEYLNSDYTCLIDGTKSIGAYVFMFAQGAIFHSSKPQPTVSVSKYEEEYMALVETKKEAIWCACFLKKLDTVV